MTDKSVLGTDNNQGSVVDVDRGYDNEGLEPVLAAIEKRAAEHDRDGSFPHEAFEELHRTGVLSLTVPAELGGGGQGLRTSVEVLEEIGKADSSVGLVVLWQLAFQADLARPGNRWPKVLRERVQRSAVQSPALINALRVEPELGTPARGGLPATTAVRLSDSAGYELSGHKIYCTGIPALRWLLVWARTDDAEPLVGTFLVEAGTPGYRVDETWDHIGLRASGSHDVIFDKTKLSLEQAVDVHDMEFWRTESRIQSFAWASMLMAANYTGIAVAVRDWLVRYLNERTPTNLGAPLASLPRFQQAVGEIEGLLYTSHRLIRDVAKEIDDGPGREEAMSHGPLVKTIATDNAIKIAEIALQLTGNPGLTRRNPLERYHRDALTGRVHTPQSDMVLTGLGKVALGQDADGFR